MNNVRLWIALVILAPGCSFVDDFDSLKATAAGDKKDAGSNDAAVRDASNTDASVDCTTERDGTVCGTSEGFICLSGTCVASRCGDGFIDKRAGEQCELNESGSSSCREDTCRYLCEDAADCDDGNTCNGAEHCDATLHTCMAATDAATDQTACTREGGALGVCVQGVCAPAGCGNGVLDMGEDCDPSVAAANGCSGCKWECTVDADCNDQNACDGEETCVNHACASAAAPSCNDGDNCTADTCAAEIGCVHTLIDLDGDGYSPYTCTSAELKGGDCADDDANRNPGKSEQCDGVDNDCVGGVDDNVLTAPCYPDADGDGFPVNTSGSAPKCKCDAGTIFARKDGQWDCYDSANGGASAFPGQTQYFTGSYCKPASCAKGQPCYCIPTWDYDCNGASEMRYPKVTSSSCAVSTTIALCTSGWTDDVAPGCGVEGTYNTCGLGRLSCSKVTQPCQ